MLRSVITPSALARLGVGWVAVLALTLARPQLESPVPGPVLTGTLLAIIVVIVVSSLGVVHQAEKLAERLGDPYGSLVLTLSIVAIEVILISAVMLGPGDNATIARDSVMAVMMIIMNLVVGLCLIVGGLRHGGLRVNRTGTSTYLGMIAVLSVLAFALPAVAGVGGAYPAAFEIPIVVLTLGAYAWFLFRQMGAQAGDYREPGDGTADAAPVGAAIREHGRELAVRAALLIATVLPIVLLSHDMAALLDEGLARVGAPVALGGLLIALIVFTPETLTAFRAALAGETQRVVNLCHGAFVSTVGLTIPAVLVIGLLMGQRVVLGESPANLLMVATTIALAAITFLAPRQNASHGALHLVLFGVYGLLLLSS